MLDVKLQWFFRLRVRCGHFGEWPREVHEILRAVLANDEARERLGELDVREARRQAEQRRRVEVNQQIAEADQRLPFAVGERQAVYLQHQREGIELDLAEFELAAVLLRNELGSARMQQARNAEKAEQRIGNDEREDARQEDDPPARELQEPHSPGLHPILRYPSMGPTAYMAHSYSPRPSGLLVTWRPAVGLGRGERGSHHLHRMPTVRSQGAARSGIPAAAGGRPVALLELPEPRGRLHQGVAHGRLVVLADHLVPEGQPT